MMRVNGSSSTNLWKNKQISIERASMMEFTLRQINRFITKWFLNPDFISSLKICLSDLEFNDNDTNSFRFATLFLYLLSGRVYAVVSSDNDASKRIVAGEFLWKNND